MNARRLPLLAALALLGLGACTSEPGPRTVAREIVDTLDLDDAVKACMNEQLDTYGDDALKDIGNADENADFSSANPDDEGISEGLRDFIADLRACVDGTATASTATDATATDDSATDESAPATTSG